MSPALFLQTVPSALIWMLFPGDFSKGKCLEFFFIFFPPQPPWPRAIAHDKPHLFFVAGLVGLFAVSIISLCAASQGVVCA